VNKVFILLFFSFGLWAQEKKGEDFPPKEVNLLSIQECIKYALKNSPSLKKIKLAHADSQYDTIIARAAFDLGLRVTSRRSEGLNDNHVRDITTNTHSLTLSQEIPGGVDLSTTGSFTQDNIDNDQQGDLSITVSKVLLGGGTLEESLEGIRDGLVDELIAMNNIRLAERNIRFRVQRQFYRIIRNIQSLAIQERRLERSKKNLEHAIERDIPLDIATAKIEIPETQLNVIAAKRQIESELDVLKITMGMPPEKVINISNDFDYHPAKLKVSDDLFFAEKNEETFVNNALRREKTVRDVSIAKTRSDVDLSVAFTQSLGSKGSETANLNGSEDSVLSLNLSFDFGQRADKARVAKSKNSLEENSINRYILRQGKFQDLRDLSRRISETETSVTIQGQRIKLNELQLELFKDRWENGEIGILEYIRSQNSLEDSRVQLINLKTNYMELLAQYLFEVGK
jgi:outer membrane protein